MTSEIMSSGVVDPSAREADRLVDGSNLVLAAEHAGAVVLAGTELVEQGVESGDDVGMGAGSGTAHETDTEEAATLSADDAVSYNADAADSVLDNKSAAAEDAATTSTHGRSLNDVAKRLVGRIQAGEASGAEIDELWGSARTALHYKALRLCNFDSDAADDLLQETLLAAHRGLGGFDAGTNFFAWTSTALRNKHINRYLAAQRRVYEVGTDDIEQATTRKPLEDGFAYNDMYAGSAEDSFLNQGGLTEQDLVKGYFGEKYEIFGIVFYLAAMQGYKYKEVAELLDVPVGTVMSRLNRARKFMAKAVKADL